MKLGGREIDFLTHPEDVNRTTIYGIVYSMVTEAE
jgi:hypothetical protein